MVGAFTLHLCTISGPHLMKDHDGNPRALWRLSLLGRAAHAFGLVFNGTATYDFILPSPFTCRAHRNDDVKFDLLGCSVLKSSRSGPDV